MTENVSRPLLAGRQSRIQAEQEAQLRAVVAHATEAATRDATARVRRAGEEATEQVKEALKALREAHLTLEHMQAAQVAIDASERRLEHLRRSVWLGAAAALLLILLTALGGLWLGGRQIAEGRAAATQLVAEARGVADAIRAAGAEEIAAVRVETDRAVAQARAEAQDRQAEALANLDLVGTQLAAALDERDAARAEIERFVALRERIGFVLAEHWNGRPVIIVPEGQEIRPWGAPGLSDLARYNGRMYRVVDQW